MVFPELADAPHGALNLDEAAARWLAAHPGDRRADGRSPFLDPAYCRAALAEIHRQQGVVWSYGGYLEDRRRIWQGSYLDQTGHYLHLGLDLNVPPATLVATEYRGQVMVIDDDGDQDGGWGMRIIFKPEIPAAPRLVLIYAHIRNARCRAGQTLAPGDLLAEVDVPPHNGNWYPHLHVQAMREADFLRIMEEHFHELDGYGPPAQLPELRQLFPDPRPWLGLA